MKDESRLLRARPFAIEAIRELGVALSEDDRDEWIETISRAIVDAEGEALTRRASLDDRLKAPIQITEPGQSAEDFVREQREPSPASPVPMNHTDPAAGLGDICGTPCALCDRLRSIAEPMRSKPAQPACEHKRGSGSINTDGSGGFKCFDCAHEVKYPATRTGPEPVPMWAGEPPRCEVCGWTLAESRDKGCVAGDCSYRPTEGTEEWYRIKARREGLRANAKLVPPAPRGGGSVTCAPCIEHDHDGPPEDESPRGGGDEGLEEEARELHRIYSRTVAEYGQAIVCEWDDLHSGRQPAWCAVARAARSLRAKGGVSEDVVEAIAREIVGEVYSGRRPHNWGVAAVMAIIQKHLPTDGASVVVDREEWERLKRIETGIERYAARDAELAASLAESKANEGYAQQARKDAEAKRSEARADAERLRGERDEAMRLVDERGGYGDVTRPGWIDAPFTAAGHIPVLTAGAAEHLRSYAISQESGWTAARNELARLRTLPATVSATRIGEAAEKIVQDWAPFAPEATKARLINHFTAILRSCTATADVDGLTAALDKAINECRPNGKPWAPKLARAALAYLGVEANPAEPRGDADRALHAWKFHLPEESAEPRAGFVPDWERIRVEVRDAIDEHPVAMIDSPSQLVIAHVRTEYERQRAEWQKGGAK